MADALPAAAPDLEPGDRRKLSAAAPDLEPGDKLKSGGESAPSSAFRAYREGHNQSHDYITRSWAGNMYYYFTVVVIVIIFI